MKADTTRKTTSWASSQLAHQDEWCPEDWMACIVPTLFPPSEDLCDNSDMRFQSATFLFLLILVGCKPNPPSRSAEFLEAFESGALDEDAVSENINVKDERGYSPLYLALSKDPDHDSLVYRLLIAGADPYQRQANGFYPIRKMMSQRQAPNFKIAVCGDKKAAEKFYEPIEGNSLFDIFSAPLFDAAVTGSSEHIQALHECGIDLGSKNRQGTTALEIAIPVNSETFSALIKYGFDPIPVRREICDAVAAIYSQEGKRKFLNPLPGKEQFCRIQTMDKALS